MPYDVIVIGSGMVGTSTAWHLQKNGSQVLMLDKKEPGEETSYGNAGLIQREALYPKAFPRQLGEIFRVLPNKSTDIRYHWSALFGYQSALFKYWLSSAKHSLTKIENEWATLIEQCTNEHNVMIEASGASNLVRKDGFFELHRSQQKLNEAISKAKKAEAKGVQHSVLSVKELQQREPDVDFSRYVGAIHWQNSWQIKNPGRLVKTYAKSFESIGGAINQASVTDIKQSDDGLWKIVIEDASGNKKEHRSQHVVIAAGPWSTRFTAPLGYKIPLFPMRGYHQHFKISPNKKLNHSLYDSEVGFIMGPMEQGIRITTGAEMTLMDAPKNFGQLEAVLKIARQVLPIEDAVESEAWHGSRPCIADMKPVIGPATNHKNLWFAFGHAHQGFTLGPATGRLIEEMIHNKTPYIDPEPFSVDRFN